MGDGGAVEERQGTGKVGEIRRELRGEGGS